VTGRLEGRTVVVTGAAGGIGEAIARRADNEGASVACLDINRAGAEAVAGALRRGVAVRCDVTDFADVEASLAAVVEGLGGVDVLVTSAGGSRGEAVPFVDMQPADWHRMVDRNLTGTFHCGLVYGRYLAQRGGGAIVLISSQLSLVVRPGLAHYAAAKGGVAQLAKGMAVDLAGAGVRVNAVAPGPTGTPGNAAWFDRPEVVAEHERIIPLRRIARPDEIAGAVIYLASDDATFTTGATIVVDGGYTIV
jgi:NAD(P)-dependent dehydrogenase (short-subunit alcohol dehydrogenase family)